MYSELLNDVSIHADPKQIEEQKRRQMTITMSDSPNPLSKKPPSQIRYYIRVIRWLVKHRTEKNNRQKWRRMERELK